MSLTAPAGNDGATGPAGAGSSITIQEEGTPLANTPHSTLNFIGTNIIATDAGGGVTDITIDPPAGDPDQNLWETIVADTGSTVANTITDSLSIIGGTGIDTAIVGDVLTITASGGGGSTSVDRQQAFSSTDFVTTSMSLVDLTGMTLTTNDLGEAGDYVVTFSCDWESENDDKDNTFAILVDGVEATHRHQTGAKKNKYNSTSLTYLAEGVAAGTVIKVQVAQGDTDSGTDELTITCKQLVIDGVGESNVI
jgi:hypothetical protein